MSFVVVWLDFFKSAIASLAWPLTVTISVLLFRKDFVSLLAALVSIKAGGVEAFFNRTVQDMPPLPDDSHGDREETDVDPAGSTTTLPPGSVADKAQEEPNWIEPAEASLPTEQVPGAPRLGPDVDQRLPKHKWRLLNVHYSFNPRKIKSREVRSLLKESVVVADHSPAAAVILAWSAVEIMIGEAARALLSRPPQNAGLAMQKLYLHSHISGLVLERFRQLRLLRNEVASTNNFKGSYSAVMDYLARVNEVATALQAAIDSTHSAMQGEPSPPAAP
ncbi:TPA: hypothetical protein UN269_000095 [Stenotrophomonas maltophilia]|nr:hypothetical protein [Stenotrophomonas maltophilia]